MAVYAAHLTRTLDGAPSIFEITAQEQLAATVKPALKKLVEFIASFHPTKFSWLVRWYDEVYLLFNTVVQYHYLKHYAASFAEAFYGLQRVAARRPEFTDGFHLPWRAERVSLLLLVLLPYLRSKLEQALEKYRADSLDGVGPKGWQGRSASAFAHIYSLLHFSYETLCVVTSLAYMTGRVRYATPALRLAGATLTYAADIVNDDESTWKHLWDSVVSGNLSSARLTFTMVGGAVLRGMEAGAFCVQFLRWWDSAGGVGARALCVPPPLQLDEQAERVMNKCPVCLQKWRIPTALPVSGYIFCYKCISRELRERGLCPVTSFPASEQDLVRMYLDQ